MNRNFTVGFTLSILIVNAYVLFFVYKWRREESACDCGKSRKLEIIIGYLIISCMINIVHIFVLLKRYDLFVRYRYYYYILFIPTSIIYTYITYLYSLEVKRKNCLCVNTDIVYYVSLLTTTLFSMTGMFLIFGAIVAFIALKRKL